jgi:twitching motility protein PilT
VILVGELRDLETIEAALRAAETGHLVFGTLHTTSAQGTITRIVDQFPVAQQEQIRVQLAGSLIGVLCQALIPRVDVRGRVAAYEFMVVTSAIANLIRENKVFRIPSSIQTGKKFGMQLLDEHLFKLFAEGKIAVEDAIDHSQSPAGMQEKIEMHKKGQIVMSDAPANPDEEKAA